MGGKVTGVSYRYPLVFSSFCQHILEGHISDTNMEFLVHSLLLCSPFHVTTANALLLSLFENCNSLVERLHRMCPTIKLFLKIGTTFKSLAFVNSCFTLKRFINQWHPGCVYAWHSNVYAWYSCIEEFISNTCSLAAVVIRLVI